MPARAGSASSSPASGYRAPGVNTGAAPSPSSPNRASARSPPRGTGPGSTGSSSCAQAVPPAVPSGAAAAPGAGRRAGTRPSAARTANVDTPVAAAIAACDFPAAASSPILCVSSAVSFDGPFGPRSPAASPASPPRRYPSSHRHSVTMPRGLAADLV